MFPTGPTGLGTAATQLARSGRGSSAPDASFPELYGPGPVRVDEDLGEEINERLVAWIKETGIYVDDLEHFRDSRYGRLVMLVHPDTDDVEQLMLAGRWMVALFAVDDYYCDDEQAGAVPEKVGPRLALSVSALDEPHLVGDHAARLRDGLGADPVLVALRSAIGQVEHHATGAQLARIRHETAAMFAMMNAEAAWRYTGKPPAVWEFLASRQPNSFLPCMTLIDVVGGYELPTAIYADPRVRRAVGLTASATVIVNDLYSMAKEQRSQAGDFNLPTLIAAEQRCSLQEAVEIAVRMHNEIVRSFESTHRDLTIVPSPELQRFLLGLRAWMGGSREWHASSVRYSG